MAKRKFDIYNIEINNTVLYLMKDFIDMYDDCNEKFKEYNNLIDELRKEEKIKKQLETTDDIAKTLNQIINNSIKYKKDNDSIIKIESFKENDKTILSIYDNGIGINKKDIKNVFKKSFTGENGRNLSKSTGMGLYIAKRLCDKLGHKILIELEKNEYTIVKIIFGNNDYYKIDN